ncbi:MAG: basic rane protein [Pseudonocardiales bacterium]|nr:basic rane protein [Pseudonocardiales bacterium]
MRRGMKFGVLAVSAALALAACSSSGNGGGTTAPAGTTPAGGNSSPAAESIKVGLADDVGGRGDKSFNDLAAAGLEKAQQDLNIETKELSAVQGESDQQKQDRLELLATAGYNPIIAIGFAYAAALGKVAPKYPDIHFAIIDSEVDAPNVEGLLFHEEQSSFLVGVAAGLATKTNNVGFIGGVKGTGLIEKFQAGYEAGVKAVNPAAKVQVQYLSVAPDFNGFNDPGKGKITAKGMYDAGADVVYHAAGGSGSGLFDAAKDAGKLAIGVDSDQYQTAPADEKDLILTSALKGVDTAVYNFIESDAQGQFKAGSVRFGLKEDGVGYSTSNPAIDPYKAQIEQYKQKIIDGDITVPTEP